jgi:hypothetical protein
MAQQTRRKQSRAEALQKVREAQGFTVSLPVVGRVTVPQPEQLAFYGGLAALAALQIVDWPVALAITAGHVLASQHHNRVLEQLGEALEEA